MGETFGWIDCMHTCNPFTRMHVGLEPGACYNWASQCGHDAEVLMVPKGNTVKVV